MRDEFPKLWESAESVESHALNDPRAGCFYARRTIELLVSWLFEHESNLHFPYSRKLAALLEEPTLRNIVAPEILTKFQYVRQLGNLAVHSGKRIRQYDAVQATKEVFHCCFWIYRTYTRFDPETLRDLRFNQDILPIKSSSTQFTTEKLKSLELELAQKDEQLAAKNKALEDYDDKIKELRDQISKAKVRNRKLALKHDYSEAETRDKFIDLLLKEAGWDPDFDDGSIKTSEYEVVGMPNSKNIGYVDYVLWSDEGKPLAIVEAKRARKDPRIGQYQAKLYADCLENMTGLRPVIFYTNGHEHWIWDDQRYPPRKIQGFLKQDELKLMIERRDSIADLSLATVDKKIADRYYQEQAIRHVTEAMANSQRKALVVMATGSGKTRTVIALCDLLQRCNWIKRVLFLADRVALVKQAVNAFKTHLPHSNPVNLVTDKESSISRVYASTYPKMMGLIDDSPEGLKRFGSGHFDLVIIDEAHRSVYQKYRAIFEYFDSYLIGLTATPRDEVDRDTYSLFELNRGVPTYAYELEQAVADGYLSPPKLVSVPIKIPQRGIKYSDLSEEDKEQWDMTEWDDEGNIPEAVEPAAVNEWLFNEDTVDKVLEHLMKFGHKVYRGQQIGKTIVFAKNHKHAVFIEERFNVNYPHLKGHFARVIDNKESYAQDLIDKFSSKKRINGAPQIAISVDMLDTGIDVPDILNLVFFKVVRSKTKFWQMIGRGTRLCENVFGPGKDKEDFYVFDFCGNFAFFNERPEGVDGSTQESIGTKIFKQRLELLDSVRMMDDTLEQQLLVAEQSSQEATFEDNLVNNLYSEVASMPLENFMVRAKRKQVETFQNKERWKELSAEDYSILHNDVAGLPTKQLPEDPTAKFFDLLILRIQHGILTHNASILRLIESVKTIASELEQVQRIPAVKKQLVLIEEIQKEDYWQDITLPMLEVIRLRLRDLVRHIEKGSRKIVTTDFEDEIGESVEVKLQGLGVAIDIAQYRKKFLTFIENHENELAFQKVKYNQPLTRLDLKELEKILFESGDVGDKEEFELCFGQQENLALFIRKLVGLDREAAKRSFDQFLDESSFNSKQIAFVNQIIDYLTQNGVMDPKILFDHPFTNLAPDGPISIFPENQAAEIIQILRTVNSSIRISS
ncbi:MAG: DEAD/DEAH box helicase family protein [Flavobacteriaceae bacterium]